MSEDNVNRIMDKFPCTSCGSCCTRVNIAAEAVKGLVVGYVFPYTWDEAGRCEKLSEDNKCLVYEDRPIMCNIDKWMRHYKLDKESFYKANITACNQMMHEDGVDVSLRITVQGTKMLEQCPPTM